MHLMNFKYQSNLIHHLLNTWTSTSTLSFTWFHFLLEFIVSLQFPHQISLWILFLCMKAFYRPFCRNLGGKNTHLCACSVGSASCDPVDCSHQAPLSMEFSRQEYWRGFPCTPPGDLPHPGLEPVSVSCIDG